MLLDPYAELFLSPPLKAVLSSRHIPGVESFSRWAMQGLPEYVAARHAYFDSRLQAALQAGISQIVLLGAGYDTRAYRFSELVTSATFFELDFPATAQRKAQIVSENQERLPNPKLEQLEIDFQKQSIRSVLSQSDFDTQKPSLFIWEGVSMYLSRVALRETLRQLHKLSCSGSELVMDWWFLLDSPDWYGAFARTGPNLLSLWGEPITFSLHPEENEFFMGRDGWQVHQLKNAADLESDQQSIKPRKIYPACYLTSALWA